MNVEITLDDKSEENTKLILTNVEDETYCRFIFSCLGITPVSIDIKIDDIKLAIRKLTAK